MITREIIKEILLANKLVLLSVEPIAKGHGGTRAERKAARECLFERDAASELAMALNVKLAGALL